MTFSSWVGIFLVYSTTVPPSACSYVSLMLLECKIFLTSVERCQKGFSQERYVEADFLRSKSVNVKLLLLFITEQTIKNKTLMKVAVNI